MQHSGKKGVIKSEQKQTLKEFKKQVLPMEVVQIYSQLHTNQDRQQLIFLISDVAWLLTF